MVEDTMGVYTAGIIEIYKLRKDDGTTKRDVKTTLLNADISTSLLFHETLCELAIKRYEGRKRTSNNLDGFRVCLVLKNVSYTTLRNDDEDMEKSSNMLIDIMRKMAL